jgi:hypothetical protein
LTRNSRAQPSLRFAGRLHALDAAVATTMLQDIAGEHPQFGVGANADRCGSHRGRNRRGKSEQDRV